MVEKTIFILGLLRETKAMPGPWLKEYHTASHVQPVCSSYPNAREGWYTQLLLPAESQWFYLDGTKIPHRNQLEGNDGSETKELTVSI